MPNKEPYIEIRNSGRVKKPGFGLVLVHDNVTASSATCTMTNGPTGTAGNPDKWITVWFNGSKLVIPAWKPTDQTD